MNTLPRLIGPSCTEHYCTLHPQLRVVHALIVAICIIFMFAYGLKRRK